MSNAPLSLRGLLRSTLIRMGLIIWAIGCGPLIAVVVMGALAGTSPNPVGLGIITMFAAPAGLFCTVLGSFLYFIKGGDSDSGTDNKGH